MSRLQLALNVDDIDEAIEYYSALFATAPAKVKPGYANFAIADPPLKLVLFEGAGAHGSINHLGVEHDTAEDVHRELDRVRDAGLSVHSEGEDHCCYAQKDEGWVDGADGHRWEIYTVLAHMATPGHIDVPAPAGDVPAPAGDVPAPAGDVPAPAGDVPASAGDVPVSAGESCCAPEVSATPAPQCC